MTAMAKSAKNPGNVNYVWIDETRCNGCVLCMKACSTKAIRVKENRLAVIEESMCIDCGECIRTCPRGAIKTAAAEDGNVDLSKAVLIVSPVLYTQFGANADPGKVISALKKKGFLHVYDECHAQELFNIAVEKYIRENRDRPGVSLPLISPVCPVAVRLIANRFPTLLKNIIPLLPPRELSAREARKQLIKLHGLEKKEIKVFSITPCSAKMLSIKSPILVEQSYLDRAMGINSVCNYVVKHLQSGCRTDPTHKTSGVGIGWCMSGGEIAAMEEGNFLAVSGIKETIRYLEKIEMGMLNGIDYVEFRTCAEGCIGGPLTVCDKYQAKHTVQRIVRTVGPERTVKKEMALQLYEKGWFFTKKKNEPCLDEPSQRSFSRAIERQEKVENIHQQLPGKECGICGSPDCRTFAEDVVDGRASLEQCIFYRRVPRKPRPASGGTSGGSRDTGSNEKRQVSKK